MQRKQDIKQGIFFLQYRKTALPDLRWNGGVISLDVQFLPDVEIPCPDCHGSRYNGDAGHIKRKTKSGELYSLPELMDMDVQQVLQACEDMKKDRLRLQILQDLGLGYLTLGEAGGRIIAKKAIPEKIACDRGGITGKYLR